MRKINLITNYWKRKLRRKLRRNKPPVKSNITTSFSLSVATRASHLYVACWRFCIIIGSKAFRIDENCAWWLDHFLPKLFIASFTNGSLSIMNDKFGSSYPLINSSQNGHWSLDFILISVANASTWDIKVTTPCCIVHHLQLTHSSFLQRKGITHTIILWYCQYNTIFTINSQLQAINVLSNCVLCIYSYIQCVWARLHRGYKKTAA